MNNLTLGYITVCESLLERVRALKPLVHHITNYVTVNDCANITLGIGASPIMADAIEEAGAIAAVSRAVVINIGTLNERTINSMIAAGKSANSAGVPVVLDPVGAGASQLRNTTAKRLLEEISFSVVRGNISEIRFLAGLSSETKGVDASESDFVTSDDSLTIASSLATELDSVVAITGATDIVSDGIHVATIANGNEMLAHLTGTGCMCSSLIGAFVGANPELPFESTVAALLAMGIAGEIAFIKAGKQGNGSFRVALHDAISCFDSQALQTRAQLEVI